MVRWVVVGCLIFLVGPPLGMVVGQLFAGGSVFELHTGNLIVTTMSLVVGTLLLVLPVGVVFAILITRTDAVLVRFTSLVFLFPLTIPLPLWLSGWLVAAGGAALDPLALASRAMPWSPGLVPAIVFHALLALPWVILILSRGLSTVDPQLEDDARLHGSLWWVLWAVTLPHLRPWMGAASLWVMGSVSSEMLITDLFQVRTWAEDVYLTQFVAPELTGAVSRALWASLVFVIFQGVVVGYWANQQPLPTVVSRPMQKLPLGCWRRPVGLLILIVGLCLVFVPLGGLIVQAGPIASYQLAWRSGGGMMIANLALVTLVGLLAATLALSASVFLMKQRTWLWVAAATVWALPGPVLGLAMKEFWRLGLDLFGSPRWLAEPLWYGPSYLPVGWVMLIRTFPLALLIVDPAVRAIPRSVWDLARLDGLGPLTLWWRVVVPLTGQAWGSAVWACAIVALGELSATKMVATPGAETFAEMVFSQLHYGVSADLAARCILMAASLGLLSLIIIGSKK